MDQTIETVIQQIETDFAKIVRLYRSVPVTAVEEQSLPNGWSVKDMLAHLAAWEWRCVSSLEAGLGSDPPFPAELDLEALNREIYEEHKEWSWSEVELDLRDAHQALLEGVRKLPPDRISDGVIQQSLTRATWGHYDQHLSELEQWHRRVIHRR